MEDTEKADREKTAEPPKTASASQPEPFAPIVFVCEDPRTGGNIPENVALRTMRSLSPIVIFALGTAGLAGALPALRTGEAIISGEAVVLPARMLITLPDPFPRAEDPSLQPWRDPESKPDLTSPLAAWRGMYEEEQ